MENHLDLDTRVDGAGARCFIPGCISELREGHVVCSIVCAELFDKDPVLGVHDIGVAVFAVVGHFLKIFEDLKILYRVFCIWGSAERFEFSFAVEI